MTLFGIYKRLAESDCTLKRLEQLTSHKNKIHTDKKETEYEKKKAKVNLIQL